jgi:ferric iron reductase protein FhuF
VIPGLAAALPPSLAAFAPRLAIGAARGHLRLTDMIRSRAAFFEATQAFAQRFPGADERAILSYWSQFYFAALIIPAFAAMVRLRRVLPLEWDAIRCDINAEGLVERFWLPHEGRLDVSSLVNTGMAALRGLHLRPFIQECASWSGLSRRVLWCNAGTMLDFAIRELDGGGIVTDFMRDQTISLETAGRGEAGTLLFQPYRPIASPMIKQRTVCCLRYRLPDVPGCGSSCPLVCQSRRLVQAG